MGSKAITREEERYFADVVKTGKTPPSVERLHAVLDGDDGLFLDAVDHALYLYASEAAGSWGGLPPAEDARRREIEALSRILDKGGSVWSVIWPSRHPAYLARRATQVTQQQVASMASGHERPGEYLTEAWRQVFGREPNPSSGYREAVRAVEAAAKPVVLPKDPGATLGKMHPALREGWKKFAIELGGSAVGPQEKARIVAEMMQLLWKGQLDRHGSDNADVPLTVSQEQAEAAAHMALLLVEWFQTGGVRSAKEAQDGGAGEDNPLSGQ